MDGTDAPPESLVETIRATNALGAISIYSGNELDFDAKKLLAAEPRSAAFDLSAEIENASEAEVLRRALVFADSLRFTNAQNHQDEVN